MTTQAATIFPCHSLVVVALTKLFVLPTNSWCQPEISLSAVVLGLVRL